MLHRPRSVEVAEAALFVVALPFAVTLAACDGPGNTGRLSPVAGLVEQVPWQNGVLPHLDATGQAIVADLPEYPPIQLGLPDLPTPWPTDCRGADAFEFSKGWFDSFETKSTDPNETGIASGWASYDDLTKFSWHTPGDATWYPGLSAGTGHTFLAPWGLPAEKVPGPSCDGTPNQWVLHFRGGLFRKWGAGISHAFTDPLGQYRASPSDACSDPNADFCPAPIAPDALVDSAGIPTHAANGDEYLQSHDFFDVSKYDGIAFWARRGPEGSASSFVILTDKFTSSRLAFENQKYCRRIRECHTRCLSGAPCSPDDPASPNPIYRCFDPKQGPLPSIPIESQLELMYPRCGPSACTSPNSYQDRDFDGKQCTPFTFPAADESGEYCWNPGQDLPPPSRDDRCQDGWQTSVELTPEWKLYTLPWSQFGQVGFGKKAPYMDLKSLDTIAFGAQMGWADVYFDNVTLYRRKK
jgi:hypothetical protein